MQNKPNTDIFRDLEPPFSKQTLQECPLQPPIRNYRSQILFQIKQAQQRMHNIHLYYA